MALPTALQDRELKKFVDADGDVAVRVSGTNFSGSFSISGLQNGGGVFRVALTDSSWTLLNLTQVSNINAIAIQNQGAVNILLAYSNTALVTDTMIIYANGGERQYVIKNTISLYLRSSSGATNAHLELLS